MIGLRRTELWSRRSALERRSPHHFLVEEFRLVHAAEARQSDLALWEVGEKALAKEDDSSAEDFPPLAKSEAVEGTAVSHCGQRCRGIMIGSRWRRVCYS